MMRPSIVLTALVGVLVFAGTGIGTAQATPIITGKLWHVPEAISLNATPANVPGTTPDVTFDVEAPFSFNGSSVTVGSWLGSSASPITNIVENTPGTLASLMDNNSQGTLLDFQGILTITNGDSIVSTHDDGLTLLINGVDQGFNPGPTSPVVSSITYLGPTGTFPFRLVYGECCQGPAVLEINLPLRNGSVPEPASLLLLSFGLLGLAVWRRKQVA